MTEVPEVTDNQAEETELTDAEIDEIMDLKSVNVEPPEGFSVREHKKDTLKSARIFMAQLRLDMQLCKGVDDQEMLAILRPKAKKNWLKIQLLEKELKQSE